MAGLLLVLAGCAQPDAAGPSPLSDPPPFSPSGSAAVPDRWWTDFEDDGLNEQIDAALAGNFTIAAAWHRLAEARAVARRAGAALWPTLDGAAGYEYEWDSETGDSSTWELGLEAGYEVDLWGRIESQAEAEAFRSAASLADYQTAALTLTAEVARTWYQLAEARAELDLIEKQLAVNQQILTVLESRFETGQILSSDILQQQQLLEATREQAIVARSRVDLRRHQLAVLKGRPPQSPQSLPEAELPAPPPMPNAGLPADLVKRRPDIQQATLTLQAADRDLSAAVSNQYPRIFITGSLTTAAERPEQLFETWLASLAGQVVAPLFDAGRREAEVRRAEAVARRRLAEYGQVVLDAFREVEDSLARNRHQLDRLQSVRDQLRLARQTHQQLQMQYLNGVTDYLSVLTALEDQQQLQRDELAARLAVLDIRIALYRALAGGFEIDRTEEQTP